MGDIAQPQVPSCPPAIPAAKPTPPSAVEPKLAASPAQKEVAKEYTLKLSDTESAWSTEQPALEQQLRSWLPACRIKAIFEHRNKSPKSFGKRQVSIIQKIEKLCAEIDPDCNDKKDNKLGWESAAMGTGEDVEGLVTRISFRCVSE